MRTLLRFPGALWRLIITYMPGLVGQAFRRRFWRKRLRDMGEHVRIDPGVEIAGPDYVSPGDGVWLDKDVTILAGEDKGDREIRRIPNPAYESKPGHVHVGARSIISGIGAGVFIGEYCGFGAGACVYSWSNHYASKASPGDRSFSYSASAPRERQCIFAGPIVLGDNVGAALNSVILPGVYLPRDCFVLIGSYVLAGNYEENSVLGGQPARRLFSRFTEKKEESGNDEP